MDPAVIQLAAVVLGGLLATGGGIATTLFVERQRRRQESRNLALAFKGEIAALLGQIEERRYLARFTEIIEQIEASGRPFFMPFRIRYRYDRVYDSNVQRIGLLKGTLPHSIPLFYTRLASLLEDMVNLGDGTYGQLEVARLVQVYADARAILSRTVAQGAEIIAAIDREYGLG
jgi:hypothetical protein